MSQPKISVIVPVYKVEPYLRKCLDSIVNQTYANLEIILVDDGSPDNCGAICDEYAARDDRIIVIHQANGGLSAARNAALDMATGDYIGFVDSDDWIELDMFEYLLTHALAEDADIAFCGHWDETPSGSLLQGWPRYERLDKETGLQALLEDCGLHNQVWDKLWKQDLFRDIRFPVGHNFEDLAIAYRLFEASDKVLCLPEPKYHYLQRSDSIIADTSLKNRMDCYIAAQRRCVDMADRWPQFRSLLEWQCITSLIGIWCGYIYNPKAIRLRFIPQLRDIAAFAKPRYKEALKYTNLGLAGRLVMRLVPHAAWWSFALAGLIGWLYKLKHGRIL